MYNIVPGLTIWQLEIENILSEIQGVAVFIDDIIVTSETEIHFSTII